MAALAAPSVALPQLAFASAPDVSDPAAAYRAGQWRRAVELGQRLGTADGLALAARAQLAPVLLAGALRADLSAVGRARQMAQSALRLAPAHVEARLQLATARGIEARRMAVPLALARGAPQEVRALLEAVLAEEPGQAWALALLAAWHLESVRQGGEAATRLLGARADTGVLLFRRAAGQTPAEPVIPFHAAAALLALGDPARETEARTFLASALQRPATDAFQTEIARRARLLDRGWATGGPAAARTLVRGWM
jgi:hypothetical protein